MYNSALSVLKNINDHGFKAYVVGGFVRDLYLNIHSIDVDICTSATPKQLKDIFGDAMLPTVQYGSVTVMYQNVRFEITTFRKDIKYENNRVPVKIKYIDSLIDDLKRRDFTINTLCMDQNGEIIDLLGAKADLDAKVIRMVGSPRKKLKEDSLRILRAVRFATILNFSLDDELKHFIKKYGYLLKKLSYFRKREELEKIFTSKNVVAGINLLKELDLVKYLELSNIDSLVITPSLIGIWAQLDVENIYNFSNNDKKIIAQIRELNSLDICSSDVLYKYGLYVCSIAGEIKGISKKIITKKYNDLPIHNTGDIEIDGRELAQIMGKKTGPYIRNIIGDLEEKVIAGKIENNRESLSSYVINNYRDIQS